MSIIVPAILEGTNESLNQKVQLITRLPEVTRIHVDFADGDFVPSVTLPIEDFDVLNPAFFWEAHLMIREPQDFLDYKIAGFGSVVVHFEAFANLESLQKALASIKQQGMQAGVAINPETNIEELAAVADAVDQVTVMSVKPGFQGSPFEKNALEKVEKLKALYPNVIIEIDGSVNEKTISEVLQAGPELLVAGSAVVKAVNPEDALKKLQQHLLKVG